VLAIFEKLGDVRSRAGIMHNMALILQACGETSEALRIYREEALPTFERSGDKRGVKMTQDHINALVGENSNP
jgi:hypothetical protein